MYSCSSVFCRTTNDLFFVTMLQILLRMAKSCRYVQQPLARHHHQLRLSKVAPLSREGWFSVSSHKFLSSSAGSTEKSTETTKEASVVPENSTEITKEACAGNTEKVVPEKSPGSTKEEGGTGSSDGTGPTGKAIRGSPVSWLSLLFLMLTGGGLVVFYDKEKKRHIEELKIASTKPRQGPSVGTAAIGGPFKLVNQDGKEVTEKDFMGKWTIIYFGFTHCPDICPDELQKLCASIDKIRDKSGIDIVPVFISVDPERDTVEQVREYVKEFHPNLIGLTGTTDEVKNAARAYRVYYMKTEQEDSDYLVDHSIVMYLMNPEMKFVKFFGKNYEVDTLVEGIIKEVQTPRN